MISQPSTDPDWRLCVAGALAASIVGLLILWLPPAWWIVELSYDMGFWVRPSPGVDTRSVLLVYMDEESHSELGQLRNSSWSRGLHARLIDRMTDAGARAVVFDCLLQHTTNNAAEDAQLVQAARRNGRVVVASLMTPEVHEGRLMGWRLQRPFEALRAVTTSGPVESAEDDHLPRRHYANYQYQEPGLAWRAAEKAGAGPLPADPMFERWINYYGPPGTFESMSYLEALKPDASVTAQLSNRVVFVGANYSAGFTGGNSSDTFRTPYTAITRRKSTGVEVIATTYLNLVRGDWLHRLSPLMETLLVAVAGTSLGLWLLRLHPVRMAGWAAAGGLGILGLSVAAGWLTRYWLPWTIPVLVQIPLLVAAGLLVHSYRTSREKFALERSLAMLANVLTPDGGTGTVAHSGGSPSSGSRMPSLPLTPTSAEQELPADPDAAAHGTRPPSIPDHVLLRRIGEGAFGEVWLARDAIGTHHAVKIVHGSPHGRSSALEREFNGIRSFTPVSRSHPGLVHILHVGRNDAAGYIYCIMELGDDMTHGQQIDPASYTARTLSRVLKREGPLPLGQVLRIGIQLCDALEHLHSRRLIHRDIKPSNIIFVGGVPKFADIGLVTEVVDERREVTALGTPGRMAPEGPGRPAADVFSLGKILYEAGFNMEIARYPELPEEFLGMRGRTPLTELNRIILRACEAEERRRYQRASELRVDLEALLAEVDGTAMGRPEGAA